MHSVKYFKVPVTGWYRTCVVAKGYGFISIAPGEVNRADNKHSSVAVTNTGSYQRYCTKPGYLNSTGSFALFSANIGGDEVRVSQITLEN